MATRRIYIENTYDNNTVTTITYYDGSNTVNKTISTGAYQSYTVDYSQIVSIKVKAKDGYIFKDTPIFDGDSYSWTVTKVDDTEYTATANITSSNATTTIETETKVDDRPQAKPILYLSYNTQNCSVSTDSTEIEITGNTQIISVSPLEDYNFSTVPYILIGSTVYNFTADSTGYYIDLNTLNISADSTGLLVAIAIQNTPRYVEITYNLTNGYKADNSETVIDNDETAKDIFISVKANEGYTFDDLPNITIITVNNNILSYILSYDRTVNAWTTNTPVIQEAILSASVTGVAVEIPPIAKDFGLLNVYKLTTDNLAELSRVRFIQNLVTGDYSDLGQYILNIYHYPFNIETSNTVKMLLGYFTTDIDVLKVTNDSYTWTGNPVLINGLYGDSSDGQHSSIRLYLPYTNFTDIDSKYINTQIRIDTTVNIISNNCIFNIYSNNNLIQSIETNIADIYPYILKTGDKQLSVKNDVSINLNKNEMFVEILQNPKVDGLNYSTNKLSVINNLTGFIKGNIIKEMELAKKATSKELTAIKMALNDGVFI